jgi:hypothetical protein
LIRFDLTGAARRDSCIHNNRKPGRSGHFVLLCLRDRFLGQYFAGQRLGVPEQADDEFDLGGVEAEAGVGEGTRLGEEALESEGEGDAHFGEMRVEARAGLALHEGFEGGAMVLGGVENLVEGEQGEAVALAEHLGVEGVGIEEGFDGGDAAMIAAEGFAAARDASAGFAGWVDVGAGLDHGGFLSAQRKRTAEGAVLFFFHLIRSEYQIQRLSMPTLSG